MLKQVPSDLTQTLSLLKTILLSIDNPEEESWVERWDFVSVSGLKNFIDTSQKTKKGPFPAWASALRLLKLIYKKIWIKFKRPICT